MKRYDPKTIESKWQHVWAESKIYEVTEESDREKQYVIAMFPYPSGAGLHVGHVRNYAITDTIARFQRQQGKNVLSTIGWDAFGLPAENYAIKTGVKPQDSIAANIANFKTQLQKVGMSFDWTREINTTDPSYYRWTQWVFTQLFDKGLAYQQESLQWWCPTDKTVLANEQVESGKCWRCGNEVEKKALKQWFFKITDYADQLLEGIDDLVWPEKIKTMQKNWIGRSQGAEVVFALAKTGEGDQVMGKGEAEIRVFTTRPDTIFGATFLVLAPEHPLVDAITTDAHKKEVASYKKATLAKSDVDRMDTSREKTGVFTGSYAINPMNDEKIPVWIADYVLMGYGTGAIMAVPAHDERDYEFATKFNLPVVPVVARDFGQPLPDTTNVEGVVVVGYDSKLKKYMGLYSKKQNCTWLAGGGREEGETFAQAAARELSEESGFKDVIKWISLGDPVYSYYYNDLKKSNRRSLGYNYLAIIDSSMAQAQHQEEHEDFTVTWSEFDDLVAEITKTGGGVDHWLEVLGRAKDAVVAFEQDIEYQMPIFHGDGVLFESGKYSGISSAEAREQIILELENQGIGNEKIQYRMRDWLISRQRYWGAPIPIIHCEKDGPVAVPEKDLPVVLPDVESYIPKGDGSISVLAGIDDWVNTTCPKCGRPAKRETDTMDGYACSSWYFLRYNDAQNEQQAWDPAKANYWMPIDYYCGGDHAVSHLLYSRFWMYFFADQGLIDPHKKEPAIRLVYNGYINAHDGQKMSKSKGNTVDPLELIEQGYGADSLRLYELFIAPYELDAAWDPRGIAGTFRFLQRLWTLVQRFVEQKQVLGGGDEVLRTTHKTIKKVSGDLHELSFNTAIAALMEHVNVLYKLEAADDFAPNQYWRSALEATVQLLAPFAPHIAEELWADLGKGTSIHTSGWPTHDEQYLATDTVTIVIQINGKLRGQIEVANDATQDYIENAARAHENAASYLHNGVRKVVYVPGKIINFVV